MNTMRMKIEVQFDLSNLRNCAGCPMYRKDLNFADAGGEGAGCAALGKRLKREFKVELSQWWPVRLEECPAVEVTRE